MEKKPHGLMVMMCFIGYTDCPTIAPAESKTNTINLNNSNDKADLFEKDIISTGLNERDLAISTDGHHLYYTIGNYNQKRRTIVHV